MWDGALHNSDEGIICRLVPLMSKLDINRSRKHPSQRKPRLGRSTRERYTSEPTPSVTLPLLSMYPPQGTVRGERVGRGAGWGRTSLEDGGLEAHHVSLREDDLRRGPFVTVVPPLALLMGG